MYFRYDHRGLVLAIFILLLSPLSAKAQVLFDLSYGMNFLSASSYEAQESSQSILQGGVYISPSGKGPLYFGLGINSVNQVVELDDRETLSTMDFVFGAKWSATKGQWLWFSLYFTPYAKASFTPEGGPKETWSGTATMFSTSFHYPLENGFSLGLSLDYWMGAYSDKEANNTTESISQSVTAFAPSLTVMYAW
jgi:hypothetical protein